MSLAPVSVGRCPNVATFSRQEFPCTPWRRCPHSPQADLEVWPEGSPIPRRAASPTGTQRPLERARRAPSLNLSLAARQRGQYNSLPPAVGSVPRVASSSSFRGISSQKGTILPFCSGIPRSTLTPFPRPRCAKKGITVPFLPLTTLCFLVYNMRIEYA